MPNTGSPSRMSAISVPQAGMPEMNDLVPSIGSSAHTYSASTPPLPNSSPMMPCSGKARWIIARMQRSAARSAWVTGSNWPPLLLSSTESEVRKNGRIASPEAVASSSTKAAKSMAVMDLFPVPRCSSRRPAAPATASGAESRHARTGQAAHGRYLARPANQGEGGGLDKPRRRFMVRPEMAASRKPVRPGVYLFEKIGVLYQAPAAGGVSRRSRSRRKKISRDGPFQQAFVQE